MTGNRGTPFTDIIKDVVRRRPALAAAVWRMRCLPGRLSAAANKYNRGYDLTYYQDGKVDNADYKAGAAHPVILSAALYAVGYGSYEEITPLVDKMAGRPMAEQAGILAGLVKHRPKHVLDVGGGRGELALLFGLCGIKTTMVDPSSGSRWFVDRIAELHGHRIQHINKPLGAAWRSLDGKPDCIVMCESIEHIPAKELDVMLDGVGSCRMVVVNHLDFWPIPRHSWPAWDHIRTIDDAVYDGLSGRAGRTIYRNKSHLVLEFGDGCSPR